MTVKALSLLAVTWVAASLLSGCATSKINADSPDIDYSDIQPGHIAYHFKDNHVQDEYAPKESHWFLKDGHFQHSEAGVPRELEFGWDFWGPELIRPMVEIRAFYILDFGGVVGADEYAVHTGLDWRYKDITIGGNIGRPWLDAGKVVWGAKIALPVSLLGL